jgi:DNA repair exonuclease SbcCD ATPase subunit
MRKLASELILLDTRVRSISEKDYDLTNEVSLPRFLGAATAAAAGVVSMQMLRGMHGANPSFQPPEIEQICTRDSLQWALDLVLWTNVKIRDHIEILARRSPEQDQFQLDQLPTMRRGQHHLEQREEQSSPARQFSGPQNPQHLQLSQNPQHPQHLQHSQHNQQPQHVYPSFIHPTGMNEDSRRNPYGTDTISMASSPHRTASSSGSMFLPPQSPMQAPQPSRAGMLPSPSSMSFSNAPSLPPISPPTTSLHTSAQAVHLQDLQHQVSVKTLAFQTLQREYDSLLQKLERQRTKCATLEKKFEVSDVEINGLTDEKEKLQAQVNVLESQVEDLQQSRDEARRQLVANGAQYMRIMEMANRLQAQGSDDKKRWETERCELEQRIKVLEEAMVIGSGQPIENAEHDMSDNTPPSIILSHNPHLSPAPSTSTETINVLRVEIGRLRSRTQILEAALQTMREESISIQAAARQLVESGGKIETAAQGAVGG